MRRFQNGNAGDIGGVRWRIVTGRKHPDDLRLDICVPRFVPVKMTLGFLLADFFTENEEVLYPSPQFQGGERYMNFLRGSVVLGWETAADQLQLERQAKAQAAA